MPGEVIDLPEAVGRLYSNYLKPIHLTVPDSELFIEDIQSEIVSEFNMDSSFNPTVNEQDGLYTPPENHEFVLENAEPVKKKGRPAVYGETTSQAEKRKLQRQKKKELESKIKDFKF